MSNGKLLLILAIIGIMFFAGVVCTGIIGFVGVSAYQEWTAPDASFQPKAPTHPSKPAREPIQLAGDGFPGAMVHRSEKNDYLMSLAKQHADSMARRQHQDHNDFTERANAVFGKLGMSASEICAESWKWQVNDTPELLWIEAFKCWKQSPGHWKVASKEHRAYGYAMAKGRNDVWYFCIIVSN